MNYNLKILFTTLLIVFFSSKVFGTAQGSDNLIYNGDTMFFLCEPLEKCFEDSIIYRDKLFKGQTKVLYTTACYRGYVAEWKIENSTLYLTAIYNCTYYENKIEADLKKIFGEKCVNGRVKADWVNGNLIAAYGKMLYYIHDDYQSIREFEIEFEIKNGKILSTKKYDNRKTKQSIYSQNDKKLMEFLKANIQLEHLPKDKMPVKVFVKFYSKENGEIKCEIIKGKSEYEEFNKEALRLIKSLPEWDIIYRRGKFVKKEYIIPVTFINK